MHAFYYDRRPVGLATGLDLIEAVRVGVAAGPLRAGLMA